MTLTFAAYVTPLYALVLALVAGYWLWRVGTEARRRQEPRVAWWAAAGWATLLLAPLLEVPALFGVGAAALLLAEYWPGAFRPTRVRPGGAWPLTGLLTGLVLLGLLATQGSAVSGPVRAAALPLTVALTLLLAGTAGLLSRALFRRLPAAQRLPGLELRFGRVRQPEWPDLSVTLTERGARLMNVSDGPLWLAGWSPPGTNTWLRVRDEGGAPLNILPSGEHAFLPLRGWEGGVRVWYVPAPQPGEARIFRADWTPPGTAERVLN